MLEDPIVQTLLIELVEDEENLDVVQCLLDGIGTDEEIAEKTGIKLNIVRKVLYKLYDEGLASYKRDKDKETQWYTYDWEFKADELQKLKIKRCNSDLKELNERLDYEENNMFFMCPSGHYRLDFEDSSSVEFLCPECGAELEFDDNQEIVNRLKEEIEFIEEIMSQ
ncbi:MAG: transcription factor E [Methanobrevibacter sp.]|nr:transcription factor E [Methanobrevibacter sp.]